MTAKCLNVRLEMTPTEPCNSPMLHDAKAIRRMIRDRRKQLDSQQQAHAAHQLADVIARDSLFAQARNIAVYLSNDGEIDPLHIIEYAWKENKGVALPVLHPFSKHHLLFIHYTRESRLVHNRFGIPEPRTEAPQICSLEELNIIFTPLVAFDKCGARIGMGGGFYDRTLAPFKKRNPTGRIIGLAHDCQEITKIESNPWDMPMDEIITPEQHIIITPRD
jgi:5-formyltetrahydrofolate cyclo-ligase